MYKYYIHQRERETERETERERDREGEREREREISSRPGQGGPDTRYFYLHPKKKDRLVAS